VLKLVKTLSNEVVDLKKNVGEGSSQQIFLTFFKKTNNQTKPPETPNLTLNLDELGMDNLYSYHQTNHLEKIVLSG
jgi:hypothetical protein